MTGKETSSRPEAARPGGRRFMLSLVVAAMLAAAVAFAAYQWQSTTPLWFLIPGAVAAATGLIGLFAAAAGLLHFGSASRQHQFLDGIADAAGNPMVVVDARGRAVYGNGPFIRLASAAGAGRLVGMDVLYAGYPEFAEPVYQLAQAGDEGKSLEREIRVAAGSAAPGSKPDSPVWLRLKISPAAIGAEQGYKLWTLEDISKDRARQEQAFGRLQFIINYLDLAPAGFFSAVPSGKIDYLNATLASWLGLDVAKSQGNGLTLAGVVGKPGMRMLARITPTPGGSATEVFDMDLLDKDGKPFPVHLIHRIDFDTQGAAQLSRSLVIPRTLMAGHREEGDDGTPRLARLLAVSPLGIAQVDTEGVIREANAAFLRISPTVRRGIRLADLVTEPDRTGLAQGLSLAMAGVANRHVVDVTLTVAERSFQFTFTRLASSDDWATVFAVDKTEHKALEVQLAQSQKMQAVGQLASGIAHDFNNVLTPIIGFADLLLAKLRPTDPSFADVMNIQQNANRAANLVRQLLAFSRRQTLQPKVHSLTEAMSDLGNLLGRVLGEKVGLKINHGRDLGLVLVDIHQFEQVIINLAVNARDAMSNGGTLTVRSYNVSVEESRTIRAELMPAAEYVAVEVEDTGSGIPPEIVDKIWEPFFSTKEVGKGTGLGLSTVYGIIKQTGGFIFCDSTIGKGTTFRIYLPRHYPAPALKEEAAPAPQAPAKRADHTGIGRILLVEDEDAVRAFAIRALTSRGYTVVEADSGESGLAIIEKDTKGFDLILSDVVMPEMDGPTMLRELRKRGIKTKVIFVSGYAEDAFEKNLEGQTDFAFLPKPFSLKQLVEKVKEVMGA